MGDVEEAADYARNHAGSKSKGQCAKYVADALMYGGGFSFTRQKSAYMYHTNGILLDLGFDEISRGSPEKGDVYVEDKTYTHPHGHIAIYDGYNWVSDFVQKTDRVHSYDQGINYYYRYKQVSSDSENNESNSSSSDQGNNYYGW